MTTQTLRQQIATRLIATAMQHHFHANALYVALHVPGLEAAEREVVYRWLDGSQTREDTHALQAVALKIAIEPEEGEKT